MTPEQAAQKFKWVKYDSQNKIVDLFLDHHMLSTLRTCEAKFVLEHILNIRPKGHKAWSLVFGTWLHSCLELYYESLKNEQVIDINEFLAHGNKLWLLLKLEDYKEEEKFEKLGGREGALSLLTQYYAYFTGLRMRVIATEITFGFDREVPLGSFTLPFFTENVYIEQHDTLHAKHVQFNCYLTGRIDYLADNGYKIGPVDHKSAAYFRGDEAQKFNPHDGITGYIYATNKIIEKFYPKYKAEGRRSLSAWVHHISTATPSKNRKTGEVGPRFKVTSIEKDEAQLEEYRLRNLETFRRVVTLLFNNKQPEWNTSTCGFMFGYPCEYRPIHETNSDQWTRIITDHYQVTEQWDPLKPDESAIARDKVLDDESMKLYKLG